MTSRVSTILETYYTRSYKEYGRLISRVRESGGLTLEEVRVISKSVLYVDACTIVRQAGVGG